jgi:hypothetical protein
MQEMSKHDPTLSSSNQSERVIQAHTDQRAQQQRKSTQGRAKSLTRDQRAHLQATCPKLKSVGAQPGSAELDEAPPTYLFHMELPHWLPTKEPRQC